ncbi:hypothetical protein A8924_0637 [Saccharopolyspora erythraea NRRL 2338]|nr:hypothetical protein A8924_0637 [Saccharopolyspora erythraea NRRL 2338]
MGAGIGVLNPQTRKRGFELVFCGAGLVRVCGFGRLGLAGLRVWREARRVWFPLLSRPLFAGRGAGCGVCGFATAVGDMSGGVPVVTGRAPVTPRSTSGRPRVRGPRSAVVQGSQPAGELGAPLSNWRVRTRDRSADREGRETRPDGGVQGPTGGVVGWRHRAGVGAVRAPVGTLPTGQNTPCGCDQQEHPFSLFPTGVAATSGNSVFALFPGGVAATSGNTRASSARSRPARSPPDAPAGALPRCPVPVPA